MDEKKSIIAEKDEKPKNIKSNNEDSKMNEDNEESKVPNQNEIFREASKKKQTTKLLTKLDNRIYSKDKLDKFDNEMFKTDNSKKSDNLLYNIKPLTIGHLENEQKNQEITDQEVNLNKKLYLTEEEGNFFKENENTIWVVSSFYIRGV